MTNADRPYVGLPDFLKLTDQNLQYLDVLVYTALKSFNNTEDELCFPTHETVGKLAGLSKRFVINSIKRLETAGYLDVSRSAKKRISNFYYFPKPRWSSRLEKIPQEIFALKKLSPYEKAMLLCIRQFFNQGPLQLFEQKPVTYIAKWLGLTEPQVSKQFNALINKGYINKKFLLRKNSDNVYVTYFLSNKIDWTYEYGPLKPLKVEEAKPLMLRVG